MKLYFYRRMLLGMFDLEVEQKNHAILIPKSEYEKLRKTSGLKENEHLYRNRKFYGRVLTDEELFYNVFNREVKEGFFVQELIVDTKDLDLGSFDVEDEESTKISKRYKAIQYSDKRLDQIDAALKKAHLRGETIEELERAIQKVKDQDNFSDYRGKVRTPNITIHPVYQHIPYISSRRFRVSAPNIVNESFKEVKSPIFLQW